MPLHMRCRYNPDEHGTYVNAVRLVQHYEQEHGDVYTRPVATKAECPECGISVTATYLRDHRRTQHGDGSLTTRGHQRRRGQRAQRSTLRRARLECDVCHHVYTGLESFRKHWQRWHTDRDTTAFRSHMIEPPAAEVPEVTRAAEAASTWLAVTGAAPASNGAHHDNEPWHADDIVIPAITELAKPSGVIPVAHLAAILVWRDATAALLDSVAAKAR